MALLPTWVAAKKTFEKAISKNKPGTGFLEVFHKKDPKGGVEKAVKTMDATLARGDRRDMDEALVALAGTVLAYQQSLEDAAKKDTKNAASYSAGLKAFSNTLSIMTGTAGTAVNAKAHETDDKLLAVLKKGKAEIGRGLEMIRAIKKSLDEQEEIVTGRLRMLMNPAARSKIADVNKLVVEAMGAGKRAAQMVQQMKANSSALFKIRDSYTSLEKQNNVDPSGTRSGKERNKDMENALQENLVLCSTGSNLSNEAVLQAKSINETVQRIQDAAAGTLDNAAALNEAVARLLIRTEDLVGGIAGALGRQDKTDEVFLAKARKAGDMDDSLKEKAAYVDAVRKEGKAQHKVLEDIQKRMVSAHGSLEKEYHWLRIETERVIAKPTAEMTENFTKIADGIKWFDDKMDELGTHMANLVVAENHLPR